MKGYQTKLKKHGKDKLLAQQRKGGLTKTRGYFGKLKDEGKYDELIRLSEKAIATKKYGPQADSSKELW